MATKTTKDILESHFTTLFAADDRVVVRILRNLEAPEQPSKRADLEKAFLYIQFPATNERPRGFGGVDIPWDERGAFMIYVLVASHSLDALADEIHETAKRSLRNKTFDDKLDIEDMFGAEAGPKFGGNWWGVSTAIEFETQDI